MPLVHKLLLNYLINYLIYVHISDLYSPVLGMSPTIDKLFEKLNKRLQFEIKVQERYMKLQGAMECFFTATGLS